jgi:hypothetical protein
MRLKTLRDYDSLHRNKWSLDMAENDLILITARIRKEQLEKLEDWRRRQDRIPPMTEAVRVLLDRGLAADAGEAKAA